PIVFFGVVFGIVYVVVSARNKERMALIQQGANPELFRSKFSFNQYNLLKWGLFLVGLALGIIAGNILEIKLNMEGEVAFPSMILLFGGLSLIVAYLLRNKLHKE
ncbi:MAG: hypothetical protein JXR22_02065, partial [Prolixibacteraceae bacterium]|nr:hypothetical protein [Prolixibacteraceae bacterium]